MTKLTDAELAEKVAVEVMGWEKSIQGDNELAYTTNGNLAGSRTFLREQWNPCNDWNDAMECVKAFDNREKQLYLNGIVKRSCFLHELTPRMVTEYCLKAAGAGVDVEV